MTACSTNFFLLHIERYTNSVKESRALYKTYYTVNVDEVLEAKRQRKRIPLHNALLRIYIRSSYFTEERVIHIYITKKKPVERTSMPQSVVPVPIL